MKNVERPGVRKGYDLWAATYDATPNPLVSLDRRVTLDLLRPDKGESILDAGCGTGQHLKRLVQSGTRAVGIDWSFGMLKVAQQAAPKARLAQADLNSEFPFARGRFDAVLCALAGEHLTSLPAFFRQAFEVLRPGGRLVFSVFHPELAAAGIEANFQLGNTEYRLGAERYSVGEYLNVMSDRGFTSFLKREFQGDHELINEVPTAMKYLNRPLLLTILAVRPHA